MRERMWFHTILMRRLLTPNNNGYFDMQIQTSEWALSSLSLLAMRDSFTSGDNTTEELRRFFMGASGNDFDVLLGGVMKSLAA